RLMSHMRDMLLWLSHMCNTRFEPRVPTHPMDMVLLRMRSGSHLYGTNTAVSDEDWFEVHDRLPGRRQSAQKIVGDQDVTSVGLSEFVRQAEKGVPQALEAMFTPDDWPEVDLISAYRRAWRPNTGAAVGTYPRSRRSRSHAHNWSCPTAVASLSTG